MHHFKRYRVKIKRENEWYGLPVLKWETILHKTPMHWCENWLNLLHWDHQWMNQEWSRLSIKLEKAEDAMSDATLLNQVSAFEEIIVIDRKKVSPIKELILKRKYWFWSKRAEKG